MDKQRKMSKNYCIKKLWIPMCNDGASNNVRSR